MELRAVRAYLGLGALSRPAGGVEGLAGQAAWGLRSRLERVLDRPDLAAASRDEAIEIYRELAQAVSRELEGGGNDARSVPSAAFGGPPLLRGHSTAICSGAWRWPGGTRCPSSWRCSPVPRSPSAPRRPTARSPGAARSSSTVPQGSRPGTRRTWRPRSDGCSPSRAGPTSKSARPSPSWWTSSCAAPPATAPRPSSVPRSPSGPPGSARRRARGRTSWAREAGIIHLYRVLELAGGALDPEARASALEGLAPLVPPVIAEGTPPKENGVRAVEVAEVRMPSGAGGRIPPLSAAVTGERGPRWLLVPGKAYRVQLLVTAAAGGVRARYWLLARPGAEGRIVLPSAIPSGMTPITPSEPGRVAFLTDRRPWSVRRFLSALQRCGNVLSGDREALARIQRHTVLREIPLPGGAVGYGALVALLADPSARARLEGTFWIDARTEEGRAVAFEIAGAVLSGNTGLRDTALQLPTAAEAARLYRHGDLFELEEPRLGLFNATRLVPDPSEPGDRRVYAIRTVLRPGAP